MPESSKSQSAKIIPFDATKDSKPDKEQSAIADPENATQGQPEGLPDVSDDEGNISPEDWESIQQFLADQEAADLPQDTSKGQPDKSAGQGQNNAAEAKPEAEKGNPTLAEQEQGMPDKSDFLAPDIDALIDSISNGPLPEPKQQAQKQAGQKEKAKPRLVATPISVIKSRAFPIDCIDGLLPQTGVAVLGGASGDGKSFLALDMGAHIVFKLDWFGRKVDRARPVCYFYLENPDGIKQRVLAWEAQNSRKITDDCGFSFFEVSLNMAQDVEELAQILPESCVLIIDTLRKANPEENENTPEGMGRILARMDTLCHLRRDILIVVVHHVPKSSTQAADSRNKLAGHYSLPADTDAVLLTERKANDDRYLWIGKSRESEDGIGFAYALRKHQVGERPDGKPVTSLAVDWTGYPDGRKVSRQKPGKTVYYAIEALKRLQSEFASNAISYKDWKDAFSFLYQNNNPKDPDRTDKQYSDVIRRAFERGRDTLVQTSCIKITDGQTVEVIASLE